MAKITWEYGHSGEIIVSVDNKRYTTVDNWEEYRAVKREILEHDIYSMLV